MGIILDSFSTSIYIKDLIESGLNSDTYQFTHLLVYDNPAETFSQKLRRNWKRKGGRAVLINSVVFRIVVKLELLLLGRKRLENHSKLYDISCFGLQSITIKPIKSVSGYIYNFSKDDVESIRKTGVDVLIRGGSGILKGEILSSARYGILSFHHGDNRVNRGGPAGFWESYFGSDQTGFIIQQLTEMLDGGVVLKRGNLETQWYFSLNQAYVLERSNYYLKQLLDELAHSHELKAERSDFGIYCKRLYTTPSWYVSLNYVLVIFSRILTKMWNRIFSLEQVWAVSFTNTDVKNLAMRKGIEIRNPSKAFLADPFIVERNGTTVCFVEEFSYSSGRGFISAIELNKRNYKYLGSVIEEPFHMSFPFVFDYEGELYMCPETHLNGDIRLYKCVEFPMSWAYHKSIMRNVSGADPVIFFDNNVWWLFVNIDHSGGSDHSSDLSAFYSDNPVDGTWIPHANNPVKIDSYGARNGGFFRKDGYLYRVGQNQGFNCYGKSFTFFRIEKLTPDSFKEVEVSVVGPDFYPNLTGTHHLSTTGEYTVYDYKRLATQPS